MRGIGVGYLGWMSRLPTWDFPNSYTSSLLFVTLLFFVRQVVAEDESGVDVELAKTAAAGNSASVGMLAPYYCKVQRLKIGETEPANEAEYWRDKDGVRIRDRSREGIVTDLRLKDNRWQVLVSAAKGGLDRASPDRVMILGDRHRRSVENDAWELSLFSLPVGVLRRTPFRVYSLQEAVAKGKLRRVGWDSIGDQALVHLGIDFPEERRRYEVWVDPGRNWAIAQAVHLIFDESGNEFWNIKYEVDEFKEVKPSVFCPTRTTIKMAMQGKLLGTVAATMKDIRVGGGLPPMPPMPIPRRGTRVADEAAGTTYEVDGNGRQVGAAYRLGEPVSPAIVAETAPATMGTARLAGLLALVGSTVTMIAGLLVHRLRKGAVRT